jgi:hypothetical protein
VASPGPGRRVESLDAGAPLPAGIYVVRLVQAGRSATARVTVLR